MHRFWPRGSAAAEQQQLNDQQAVLEQNQTATLQSLFSERVQLLAQNVGLFQASITGVMESIEASIQPLDGILTQAINGFAESLGSVVEQYVLMGKTGPAVIRKLLAAQLAAIAKEAAVNAIKQTALGFAALFTNPAEAGSHFASAAQWALLAGTAGAVGLPSPRRPPRAAAPVIAPPARTRQMVRCASSIRVAPCRASHRLSSSVRSTSQESLSSRSSTTTAPMERCVKRSDVIF
jgi:hypothetical protein